MNENFELWKVQVNGPLPNTDILISISSWVRDGCTKTGKSSLPPSGNKAYTGRVTSVRKSMMCHQCQEVSDVSPVSGSQCQEVNVSPVSGCQ